MVVHATSSALLIPLPCTTYAISTSAAVFAQFDDEERKLHGSKNGRRVKNDYYCPPSFECTMNIEHIPYSEFLMCSEPSSASINCVTIIIIIKDAPRQIFAWLCTPSWAYVHLKRHRITGSAQYSYVRKANTISHSALVTRIDQSIIIIICSLHNWKHRPNHAANETRKSPYAHGHGQQSNPSILCCISDGYGLAACAVCSMHFLMGNKMKGAVFSLFIFSSSLHSIANSKLPCA